jgi:hypothetical protein
MSRKKMTSKKTLEFNLLQRTDYWMKHIWKETVKQEYDSGQIFEESNLHSTVYFHLRKLIERSGKRELLLYSEMPFSKTRIGKGKSGYRWGQVLKYKD